MAVRINNSLASLLSSNKENSRVRPRHRSKRNYRRFSAVSAFGDLNTLAATAAQTFQNGEEHFGQTLTLVKEKSRQGKHRSELKQQQFAWREEHRALSKEQRNLEREISDGVMRVASSGLSAPLDEWNMSRTMFIEQHQPQAKEQVVSIRHMMLDIDPYEAATILFEINEANHFLYNASEVERVKFEKECRESRNRVYQLLRSNDDEEEQSNKQNKQGGGRWNRTKLTTRTDLWDRISSLKHCDDIHDVSVIHSEYEKIAKLLDDHLVRAKGMRVQLDRLLQKNRGGGSGGNETKQNWTHRVAALKNDDEKNEKNEKNEQNDDTTIPVVVADAAVTIGGWLLSEHQMFVKIWKECIDRGKGHGSFRKRMAMLLPHIGRDDLTEHVSWFERHRYLQRQLREENVRWERLMIEKLSETENIVLRIYQEEKRNETRQAQLEQMQKKGGKLHAKLREMRTAYEERQRREEKENEKLQKIHDEEEKKRIEAEDRKRNEEKKNVQYFQDEKKKRQEREREMEEEYKKSVEDATRAEAPVREARIEHRRVVLAQREEERKNSMAQAERQKEEISKSLEKLKTQCLYFEKIQDIKENQDPLHVLQVTRAFDIAVKEMEALRAAGFGLHARGHAPLNGFQSKKIVGDIRFKLVEQLRTAGLQATPYAQACIMNMAREMRPMPVHDVSAGFPVWAPRIQP